MTTTGEKFDPLGCLANPPTADRNGSSRTPS